MDLGIIILSKSKSERERQMPYDITYMWNLKYDTKQYIFETETDFTDRESRLMVAKGVGEGWIESLGLADVSSYI